MGSAILRKAIADLRTHRLQTLLVFLILTTATATLTVAITIRRGADDPWQRASESANGADVTFYAFRPDGRGELADLTSIAGRAGVAAASEPVPAAADRALVVDGNRHAVDVQAVRALPAINRPIVSDGSWLSGAAEEIVLDRALARSLDIEPGDSVEILGADGLVALRVSGLSVSPWRAPSPYSVPIAWVTPETLRAIEPREEHWYWTMGVQLTDRAVADIFAIETATAQAGRPISWDTWSDVRDDVSEWNRINALFVGMFSVFALLAAGLIISNVIAARVLAQYRDIGLLKAVGFTPAQVVRLYLVEHLAIALVAALTGIALGTLIAPSFLQRLADSLHTKAAPSFEPLVALGVLALVLTIVAVFTVIPARRGGQVPVVRAVAVGFSPPSGRASRLAQAASALRLPPVVVLGVKDAFARPWRAVATVASLTLTVVTVVFALGMDATFDRIFGTPALQGEPYDIVVERGELPADDLEAVVAANPDIARYHARLSVGGARLLRAEGAPGAPLSLRAIGGNPAAAGYIVPEGRIFSTPGEAVAGMGLFEQGFEIGDTVDVTVDGRLLGLTITGRYLDDDEDGHVLLTSLDTIRQVTPDAQPDRFLATLRDGADEAEVERALLAATGYRADVWTLADEEEGDTEARNLRVVMGGLAVVLLAIGLINLLATTLLNVRERIRDVGILKAIGFTPLQVVTSVVTSVAYLALLATIVGIPLGLVIGKLFYDAIAVESLGAIPEWYARPSTLTLLLLLPATLLVAVLASLLPAGQAARTRVTEVLRSE